MGRSDRAEAYEFRVLPPTERTTLLSLPGVLSILGSPEMRFFGFARRRAEMKRIPEALHLPVIVKGSRLPRETRDPRQNLGELYRDC